MHAFEKNSQTIIISSKGIMYIQVQLMAFTSLWYHTWPVQSIILGKKRERARYSEFCLSTSDVITSVHSNKQGHALQGDSYYYW
jgi:hypothetical protein